MLLWEYTRANCLLKKFALAFGRRQHFACYLFVVLWMWAVLVARIHKSAAGFGAVNEALFRIISFLKRMDVLFSPTVSFAYWLHLDAGWKRSALISIVMMSLFCEEEARCCACWCPKRAFVLSPTATLLIWYYVGHHRRGANLYRIMLNVKANRRQAQSIFIQPNSSQT